MLINNSLPVAGGKIDTNQQSIFSRKLIIDKKILYRMLLDLQRYRKLQNLKKSFFIFHRSYDGKPPEMAKWHDKVEIRVTQTFRQLNIRRIIAIIGYDPSSYFKGEMSYMNMEQIKRGNIPENIKQVDNTQYGSRRNIDKSSFAHKLMHSPMRPKEVKQPTGVSNAHNLKRLSEL